jgi:uncharacterized OsmC-like protein
MPGTIIPFELHGTGSQVLSTVAVGASGHKVTMEGHPAFGGTDSSPSPLDLVLASLVACTQVTGTIVATGMSGVELGGWDISLKSNLDNSVLVFGEQGISNFGDVSVSVSVQTNLSDDEFTHLTDEIERRCPITTLFRGSGVDYTTTWTNIPLGG